jgi:hypothetical protein
MNFELRNVTSEVRLIRVEAAVHVVPVNTVRGDKELGKFRSVEISLKMTAGKTMQG